MASAKQAALGVQQPPDTPAEPQRRQFLAHPSAYLLAQPRLILPVLARAVCGVIPGGMQHSSSARCINGPQRRHFSTLSCLDQRYLHGPLMGRCTLIFSCLATCVCRHLRRHPGWPERGRHPGEQRHAAAAAPAGQLRRRGLRGLLALPVHALPGCAPAPVSPAPALARHAAGAAAPCLALLACLCALPGCPCATASGLCIQTLLQVRVRCEGRLWHG